MLAPGLANVVLVQHLVLGGVCGAFWNLFVHFGGLLEKHLFLGRRLLLQLQGYQTCAGAGMLDVIVHFGSLLKKLLFLGRTLLLRLWASKPVLVQEWWLQG